MENFFCVKGNTWCISTATVMVGVYRLNERDAVLLDSGSAFQPNESSEFMDTLSAAGLHIKAIIATHGHWDHVGNNKALIEKFGCEIYMYGAEAYISKSVHDLLFQWMPIPFHILKPMLERMESLPTAFLAPNQKEVEICGKKFGILHTPGHSQSHIAIITEDHVAMLGDALMSEQVLRHSKLPYAEDISVDLKTKEMLVSLPYERYILSHKGVLDKAELLAAIQKNISHIKQRAEAVAEYIEDGMTFDALAAAVINGMHIHIYTRLDYADICKMIAAYVRYLEECGQIEARYENGYLRYHKK